MTAAGADSAHKPSDRQWMSYCVMSIYNNNKSSYFRREILACSQCVPPTSTFPKDWKTARVLIEISVKWSSHLSSHRWVPHSDMPMSFSFDPLNYKSDTQWCTFKTTFEISPSAATTFPENLRTLFFFILLMIMFCNNLLSNLKRILTFHSPEHLLV